MPLFAKELLGLDLLSTIYRARSCHIGRTQCAALTLAAFRAFVKRKRFSTAVPTIRESITYWLIE
jgi:hypothetical protein